MTSYNSISFGLSIFLSFWPFLAFLMSLKIYLSHCLFVLAETMSLFVSSNRRKLQLSLTKWSQCPFLQKNDLLFSANNDTWVLSYMKSLCFKFYNLLNLTNPIKERTRIIRSLKFIRFISAPLRYWKALFQIWTGEGTFTVFCVKGQPYDSL